MRSSKRVRSWPVRSSSADWLSVTASPARIVSSVWPRSKASMISRERSARAPANSCERSASTCETRSVDRSTASARASMVATSEPPVSVSV